jgi:hypothetical protein
LQSCKHSNQTQLIDFTEIKYWHDICCIPLHKEVNLTKPSVEKMTMSSTALLALNTAALTMLMTFHFQPTNDRNTTQISQASAHHLQQRPQLAVMSAKPSPPIHPTQDTQTTTESGHWVF